ncbi:MAG: hypothetical protein ABWZ15_08545, partial [Acidimicrobiia bacterium]
MRAKKWFAIGAAVATAAAGLAIVNSAGATLPGSTFEGNDGNQIVNGGAGALDWQNAPNLEIGV